jgi:hypothetical protein
MHEKYTRTSPLLGGSVVPKYELSPVVALSIYDGSESVCVVHMTIYGQERSFHLPY